jgi:hypothetical protein
MNGCWDLNWKYGERTGGGRGEQRMFIVRKGLICDPQLYGPNCHPIYPSDPSIPSTSIHPVYPSHLPVSIPSIHPIYLILTPPCSHLSCCTSMSLGMRATCFLIALCSISICIETICIVGCCFFGERHCWMLFFGERHCPAFTKSQRR